MQKNSSWLYIQMGVYITMGLYNIDNKPGNFPLFYWFYFLSEMVKFFGAMARLFCQESKKDLAVKTIPFVLK